MILKKIFPYENYHLTSNLSIDEVKRRIMDNIGVNDFGFFIFNKKNTKPFEGKFVGNTFTIRPLITGGNSFLPMITGHISTNFNQTKIHIKMRLQYVVIIGMSSWIGGVGFGFIKNLIAGLLKSKEIVENVFSADVIIPFTMFIFGCLLIRLPFKAESKKSKYILAELLEGQENNL